MEKGTHPATRYAASLLRLPSHSRRIPAQDLVTPTHPLDEMFWYLGGKGEPTAHPLSETDLVMAHEAAGSQFSRLSDIVMAANPDVAVDAFAPTAMYHPADDELIMPTRDRYPDQAAFWGALSHEMVHWTGHPSRLSRNSMEPRRQQGDLPVHVRLMEEAIASLGASMLVSEGGLDPASEMWGHVTANYLRDYAVTTGVSWQAALAETEREAQRAVRYLVDLYEGAPVPSPAPAPGPALAGTEV